LQENNLYDSKITFYSSQNSNFPSIRDNYKTPYTYSSDRGKRISQLRKQHTPDLQNNSMSKSTFKKDYTFKFQIDKKIDNPFSLLYYCFWLLFLIILLIY